MTKKNKGQREGTEEIERALQNAQSPACILFQDTAGLWYAGLLNDERPSYDDLSKENLGIGLLSHTKVCSIMGDEELDCRVRNGIGYTLFSMDTKEIFKCIIDRDDERFVRKTSRTGY